MTVADPPSLRPALATRAANQPYLLLSLMAPVLMAYQTRSVWQVLMGRDGGWPANVRGDATLTLREAWAEIRSQVQPSAA